MARCSKPRTIKISYKEDSTQESRVISRCGAAVYCVKARASWFPSYAVLQDRTQFDLRSHLAVRYQGVGPARTGLAATGEETSSQREKGNLEAEWRSEVPFSAAGFNYADFAGPGVVTKSQEMTFKTYSEVETSGWAAWYQGMGEADEELNKRVAVAAAQPYVEMPSGGEGDWGAYRFRNQHAVDVIGFHHAAETVGPAMQLFQFFYGPLPFHTLSITQRPARGYAESWPTLLFLPYSSLPDPRSVRSLGPQVQDVREFNNLPAVREVARQWWGVAVGPRTYHDEWLFDGLAEFSAGLYLGQFQPTGWNTFWDLERNWLLSKGKTGRRPVDAGPLWLGYQAGSHEDAGRSWALSHYRGAYVLQMLRALMADPKSKNPDGGFIAMMQDFAKIYAGQNASTADFQGIVEKHMGQPMDWFFNEWVYGTETPHYDFSYQLGDAGGGKTLLTMSLKQSEVSDSFVMEVPLYAELNKRLFQLGLIRMQGSSVQSGKFPLAFRPDRIILDANHSILGTISQ